MRSGEGEGPNSTRPQASFSGSFLPLSFWSLFPKDGVRGEKGRGLWWEGQAWGLRVAVMVIVDGDEPGGASAGLSSASPFLKGQLGPREENSLDPRLNSYH